MSKYQKGIYIITASSNIRYKQISGEYIFVRFNIVM